MIETKKFGALVWTDVVSPNKEEVRSLMQDYGIHPSVGEELLAPSVHDVLRTYGPVLYIILSFPASRHTHSDDTTAQEVNFIVGESFLVTTRYDTIDAIHKFSKEFEVQSILESEKHEIHGGALLFALLRKLYRSVEHEIEYIENHIRDIEENIFKEREKEMVAEISRVSRVLLDFKKVLSSHGQILKDVQPSVNRIFSDTSVQQMQEIRDMHARLVERIGDLRSIMQELRETNNSLLYTKQNEVMKILTIMAFVTFPLSLIAGIFGMNTLNTPVVGDPNDFWMIVGLMLALMLAFFGFFKYKKWL